VKTLILMRHGHAEQGEADHARRLSARGKQQCQGVAKDLREVGIKLDHVLCSNALRAEHTAKIVALGLAFAGTIEASSELYGASAAGYLQALQATEPQISTLLFVAHNPSISDLIRLLLHTEMELDPAGYTIIRDIKHWPELGR